MYKISLFKVASSILVHLQGGKKKLRDKLKDSRSVLASKSQVTHQFGGSVLKKSNRGSRYLAASKQFLNRSLGRSSHTSSMRSSVTPISLKEQGQASLDSTRGESKSGSSYDGMQLTKNIDTLFHLPTNLYPYYRKIPNIVHLASLIMSMMISYIIHFKFFQIIETDDAFDSPPIEDSVQKEYFAFGNMFVPNLFFGIERELTQLSKRDDTLSTNQDHYDWVKFGLFLATSAFIMIVGILFLHDFHFFPSRVSHDILIEKKWFPSPLSRFSFVHTEIPFELNHDESFHEKDEIKMKDIGVHYLEYKNKKEVENPQDASSPEISIDLVHFMHGFGSCSMNWLPIMKPMVQSLDSRVGIAHCGAGFGLSSRPNIRTIEKEHLAPYSSSGWAMVGNSLMIDRLNKDKLLPEEDLVANAKNKRVVLIGHSMGCAATLKMALTLPAFQKIVILVAPALIGEPPKLASKVSTNNFMSIFTTIKTKIMMMFAYIYNDVIMDPLLRYCVSRGTGTKGFWSEGIKFLADYEPSDELMLLFEWSTISKGWQDGVVAFAKSRALNVCPYAGGELELLDDVLMLPEVRLCIIHGTNDTLVPISISREIVKNAVIDIDLIEMEGIGHMTMLQDEEKFINIVQDCVDKLSMEFDERK